MSTKNLVIINGTVVIGQTVSKRDILIQDEIISAIGDLSGITPDEVIDASGLLVFPGAIDVHVHFDDVFMGTKSVHDYYKGTLAAAHGGVTTIIDFSNQIPDEPLINTLLNKQKDAEGNAVIDYGVHPVITNAAPDILDEIPLLVDGGAPSFKCYMTYKKDGLLVEDKFLRSIMERLKDAGGMLMVHAEDNDILEENISRCLQNGDTQSFFHAKSRPPEAEDEAIRRLVKISKETGCRLYIAHLSSDKGMKMIGDARAQGLDVLAETCTHYLFFTEEILKRDDGMKWICSPPLRSRAIQDNLWNGIKDGRLSLVSSDDAAYSWEAKLMGKDRFDTCPNGIAGVETRLSILYSEGVAKGRITLPRFVELISTSPANLFGLAPRKGSLVPGADADIVLFDPNKKWIMNHDTLHMGTDYAAYDNIEITGKIMKVYSRGELIIDNDKFLAEKGRGNYLFRKLDLSIRAGI